MPFEKGKEKTGGREKGSENKLNREARELFVHTLANKSSKIDEAFDLVFEESPARFLDLFAKYAQYFVPKKTEAEIKADVRGGFDFNEVIERLKGDK